MSRYRLIGNDKYHLIQHKADTGFEIQRKTGVVLFILAAAAAFVNLYRGINIFNDSFFNALLHYTVLPTFIGSIIFLITVFIKTKYSRYLQVFIILGFGFTTTMLTEPGNLTGSYMFLLAFALLYQYDFLSNRFVSKVTLVFISYLIAFVVNTTMISNWKFFYGIPTILFTIASFYLFWVAFNEEIKNYLFNTDQLNIKIDKYIEENVHLSKVAQQRKEDLIDRNMELQKQLKEKTLLEENLRRTIEQKEVLLREVHHRVKNNLTVMLSILNLQLDQNLTEEMKDFILKNKNRIQAMATVHDLNYQEENYSTVELGYYLRSIVDDILVSYDLYLDINKTVEVEDCIVTLNTAIACGLILNECVTNSIKHAFVNMQDGKELTISGKYLPDNSYKLTISDNGNGSTGCSEMIESQPSFGIWLIKNIAEGQLNGSADCRQHNGTIWDITFPLSMNHKNTQ